MAEEDAAKDVVTTEAIYMKEEQPLSHNRPPHCTRLDTVVFLSLEYVMALFTLHYNSCFYEGNQFA